MKFKKSTIILLLGVMIFALGAVVLFIIEDLRYTRLLENAIKEVKRYQDIHSLSQLSDKYYYKDTEYPRSGGISSVNKMQFNNFWMCQNSGKDASLRFSSRENGVICLEHVVFKAESDDFYYLYYNTETDKYYIKKYDDCIKVQDFYVDESDMMWKYTDVYLGKKEVFLYRTESAELESGVGFNFVETVKQCTGENASQINLLFDGDSANEVTDELEVFLNNRNLVGYVMEYRYISTQTDKSSINMLCYTQGKYYHICYNISENKFILSSYTNLWEKSDVDGSEMYILSNLPEDAKYERNSVFSENMREYLYLDTKR